MRTTLELDDRLLRAARAMAEQRGISLGTAVSELALRGLAGGMGGNESRGAAPDGFPLLPLGPADHVITDELVAEYRDDA
ncbi:hypothetical protein [Agromyces sp. NPDC049794]|uniref:hypothetical protein n=1 Tax=unclassified Agromyces TaxID=2639701 RepID=UPI0033C405B5